MEQYGADWVLQQHYLEYRRAIYIFIKILNTLKSFWPPEVS